MTKKKRKQNRTRLSGRNALTTLNDLLRVVNPMLPKAHRLSPVETPTDLYALRQRIEDLEVQKTDELVQKDSVQKVEVVPSSVIRVLSAIATNAWRARNRMVDSGTGEAREEMKRVYRHIEAVFDALKQIGVEVIDPQGRAYDSGMALKVVSFEQTPGLSKEEVTETIKPTITWQGQLIQMGEVIVGTPQTK